MSRAVQKLHKEADVLSVQTIRAGEVVAQLAHSYRVFWLETEHEAGSRKLVMQPPGTAADRLNTAGCKGYVVSFPEEFLFMFGFEDAFPFRARTALPGPQMATVNLLNCATGRTIERTIANLDVQCQRLPKGHLLVSGLLKIFLVSVSRMFQHREQDQASCIDQQLFEQFMHLVGQHAVTKKGIQNYAGALSIRAEVLSETIKRVSGRPASHHIYQHIIRTAKHAAIRSGSTMKEVAYGLGFKDVAHFSKFFRNKAGMTFSDYKKAYQLM